jgi:hypothetical protein
MGNFVQDLTTNFCYLQVLNSTINTYDNLSDGGGYQIFRVLSELLILIVDDQLLRRVVCQRCEDVVLHLPYSHFKELLHLNVILSSLQIQELNLSFVRSYYWDKLLDEIRELLYFLSHVLVNQFLYSIK